MHQMGFQLPDDDLLLALSSWDLPHPPLIRRMEKPGTSADVWEVRTGGDGYVAKFAYDTREGFEDGLCVDEILERHGFRAGGPVRTREGELTRMVEGPPGKLHPLALFRFVSGRRLGFGELLAPTVIGENLGLIHRILIEEGYRPSNAHGTLEFLIKEGVWTAETEWVPVACKEAVEAARQFEDSVEVTYGTLYGDYPEFLIDEETGQVGLIDWGTVSFGPLLFDVAIGYEVFSDNGYGAEEFINRYLEHSPMRPEEIGGLKHFLNLHYARMAKYFAWRSMNEVTSGGMNQDHNRRTLALYRSRLGY